MPFDVGQALHLAFLCVITGLLIWLGISVKDWYNNPGDRPSWLINIINVFNKPTYQVIKGLAPASSNLNIITDTGSVTANACASNCSMSYACNGFTFNNSTANCQQVTSDFGTLVMIPYDSNAPLSIDTYVKSGSNLPKWGFLAQAAGTDYAFASNLISQELGTVYSSNNSTLMANTCIQNASSNCVGFSINTNTISAWLVNSTANTATTANVISYNYGTIPSTLFMSAGF